MRHTSSLRLGIGAGIALLVACRADSLTDSIGRTRTPPAPLLALSGAVGTRIFPEAPPGEFQPRGNAIGLNQAGQVTGAATGLFAVENDIKAFRWSPGVGVVGIVGCCGKQYGADINDAGVVVGTAQIDAATGLRGFVASGNTAIILPTLPGAAVDRNSYAYAINDAGQSVGFSATNTGANHAVLWNGTEPPQDLGTLGGNLSVAIDVNGRGQVLGYSFLAGDATLHFFLWSSSTGMQDIDTVLGSRLIDVAEINDAGQMVGTFVTSLGEEHAFLYTPGSGRLDLGTLGGEISIATGLNEHGDVVGMSVVHDSTMHAFLWTSTDGMEDVTAITGVPEIRRLNDHLQTLTGTASRNGPLGISTVVAKLVQLQVTPPADAPPVARFTFACSARPHANHCTFDASRSTDDVGIVTYLWDWGNGRHETRKTSVAKNTWPKSGSYLVTLTVIDTKGQSTSIAQTVSVP